MRQAEAGNRVAGGDPAQGLSEEVADVQRPADIRFRVEGEEVNRYTLHMGNQGKDLSIAQCHAEFIDSVRFGYAATETVSLVIVNKYTIPGMSSSYSILNHASERRSLS